MADEVSIVETGCNGFCAGGPIMVVYPGGFFYQKVQPEDTRRARRGARPQGPPGRAPDVPPPRHPDGHPAVRDIPFFARQNLRVLRNKGRIAAKSIEEYIARDGYQALAKALTEMTPEEVIDEIKTSGLRGRGGAGFPTGLKWEFTRQGRRRQEVRRLQRRRRRPRRVHGPQRPRGRSARVIEGMIIAATAIGADAGLHLLPRRVSAGRRAARRSPSPQAASAACSARTSSAPASTSTSRSAWAPARSSAARRRP